MCPPRFTRHPSGLRTDQKHDYLDKGVVSQDPHPLLFPFRDLVGSESKENYSLRLSVLPPFLVSRLHRSTVHHPELRSDLSFILKFLKFFSSHYSRSPDLLRSTHVPCPQSVISHITNTFTNEWKRIGQDLEISEFVLCSKVYTKIFDSSIHL